MATRTTHKRIQHTEWSLFQNVSSIISSLFDKMRSVFSTSDDEISKTISEIREEQLTNFDTGFTTKAYLYSRRI